MLPQNLNQILRAGDRHFSHLTEEEVNRLTASFQRWADGSPPRYRKRRVRHLVIFLVLRFTGARLGEVLKIDDARDINWREAEIVIPTLKRKTETARTVPVPPGVVAEIGRVLAEFPDLRGKLFRVSDRAFRYIFRDRGREAGLAEGLCHPHVLRHTRALELLRSGVPVTAVQQLLGHAHLTTTAIYLRFSGVEVKKILKDRGLI